MISHLISIVEIGLIIAQLCQIKKHHHIEAKNRVKIQYSHRTVLLSFLYLYVNTAHNGLIHKLKGALLWYKQKDKVPYT